MSAGPFNASTPCLLNSAKTNASITPGCVARSALRGGSTARGATNAQCFSYSAPSAIQRFNKSASRGVTAGFFAAGGGITSFVSCVVTR
ncbi:MAG: hypothetical protein QM811_23445 [Pirellulales bacterium]